MGIILLSTIMATLSSSSIGSTIFSGIWDLIMKLLGDITSAFGTLISQAFGGFGQSIVTMFQTFGYSLSPYGIWAPVAFVIGLGLAMVIGYIFFDIIDGEKDITGIESDM